MIFKKKPQQCFNAGKLNASAEKKSLDNQIRKVSLRTGMSLTIRGGV